MYGCPMKLNRGKLLFVVLVMYLCFSPYRHHRFKGDRSYPTQIVVYLGLKLRYILLILKHTLIALGPLESSCTRRTGYVGHILLDSDNSRYSCVCSICRTPLCHKLKTNSYISYVRDQYWSSYLIDSAVWYNSHISKQKDYPGVYKWGANCSLCILNAIVYKCSYENVVHILLVKRYNKIV